MSTSSNICVPRCRVSFPLSVIYIFFTRRLSLSVFFSISPILSSFFVDCVTADGVTCILFAISTCIQPEFLRIYSSIGTYSHGINISLPRLCRQFLRIVVTVLSCPITFVNLVGIHSPSLQIIIFKSAFSLFFCKTAYSQVFFLSFQVRHPKEQFPMRVRYFQAAPALTRP